MSNTAPSKSETAPVLTAPRCPGMWCCNLDGIATGGMFAPLYDEPLACPYGCKTVEARYEAGECTCYDVDCSVHGAAANKGAA